MVLYVMLFIAMICLRAAVGDSGRSNRRVYIGLAIFLFLFSGFRYSIGNDWPRYGVRFAMQQWKSASDTLTERDPGFWLMNDLVEAWGLPYPVVNVLSTAVFLVGLHVLARRQPDPLGFLVLTFPILIINMPMSATRQAMGIGLMCVAFSAFIDKRLISYVAWTLAATLFHSSAICFLLLVPLVHGEITARRLVFSGLLALPGALALTMTSEAEMMAERYIESSVDAAGAVFRVGLLAITGAFYFMATRETWQRQFPQDYRLASLGALMMLATFPVVFVSTVIGDRFGYYLIPIQAMIFARFPYLFRGNNSVLFGAAPYLGLLLVFVVWTRMSWHFRVGYVPYQTWLFGFPGG